MGDSHFEHAYWSQMYANACDQSAPSFRIKPPLFRDGNQWCALYGNNLQEGVVGFGRSPDEAYRAFDRAWTEKLP